MHDSPTRVDATIAFALFAVSVLYLTRLPHDLGFADESYFLYEAKRLRDGELLYRDVFQYVTPLSSYLMAALYAVFGTTMTTARVSMAVVQGIIVVLTYMVARAVRVRPALAAVAALAHVTISYPAWPFASWHWFSSALTLAVLLALLQTTATRRQRFGLGILCGLLISVQQQRGLFPTAAVGLSLLLEPLIDRRYANARSWSTATIDVIVFGGGIGLVVVPVLLTFISLAGAQAVTHALVEFPLQNYRASAPNVSWGSVTGMTARYAADTFPRLLGRSPLVLAIPLLCALVDFIRGRARARVRQLIALGLIAGATVLSIWYNNDFIHIAFIAAPLFVCAALGAELTIESVPIPESGRRWIGGAMALVALAVFGRHLESYLARKWQQSPFPHMTAFGRIDFRSQAEVQLTDMLRKRLADDPAREIFCYPNLASPYLTTGAHNPTPFQHFSTWVFPAEDTRRVIAILQERRVPYIVVVLLALQPDDPVAQLINRDYRLVEFPALPSTEQIPSIWLYERKDRSQAPPSLPAASTQSEEEKKTR